MAITAQPYGCLYNNLFEGRLNVLTDALKIALLSATYTPDLDAHTTFADVSASQIAATGYTIGGNTLTGVSKSYNTSTNTVTVAAADTSWTNLTATFRYAVVYKNSTADLVGLIDFGADRSYNAEAFQLSFPSGLMTLSPAA